MAGSRTRAQPAAGAPVADVVAKAATTTATASTPSTGLMAFTTRTTRRRHRRRARSDRLAASGSRSPWCPCSSARRCNPRWEREHCLPHHPPELESPARHHAAPPARASFLLRLVGAERQCATAAGRMCRNRASASAITGSSHTAAPGVRPLVALGIRRGPAVEHEARRRMDAQSGAGPHGSAPPAGRVHVLGAGPVGLLLTALLQPLDWARGAPLREAPRLHAHADGPARLLPRRRFGRGVPCRPLRRGQRRGRLRSVGARTRPWRSGSRSLPTSRSCCADGRAGSPAQRDRARPQRSHRRARPRRPWSASRRR